MTKVFKSAKVLIPTLAGFNKHIAISVWPGECFFNFNGYPSLNGLGCSAQLSITKALMTIQLIAPTPAPFLADI